MVIIGIGAGLVIWKSKAGDTPGSFNTLTKAEVELLLADVVKQNPMALKRFKEEPELKKQQLDNMKELLAFASQAQKEGLVNESPNKDELENIRAEVTAVTYDREINKDKGPMPPFGFINEDQVKVFWGEVPGPDQGFWQNLKDKVGLGKKDAELGFTKFLESKVAIMKKGNPQMADRELSEDEKKQAREFYAKIQIYDQEFKKKASAGEISKEVQDKVNLQVKLQQASFLAKLYSEKLADKLKVSDEDIAKYLTEHPELDPAAKKAKAEEILNRAKGGEDFAKLANEFSEDPGNDGGPEGKRGGLYENIRMGQMVKPFEEGAMAVEPGQVNPSIIETDFGFHIIKLESKKAAVGEGDNAEPGTYSARHILISTGVKDATSPMGRDVPVKQFVSSKLQEEKEKKLIEEIVASNHVTVPDDFDVPEVTEEQMQDAMKRQMQQMGQGEDDHGDEHGAPQPPPPAAGKKPEPKKPEPKK